MKGFFFFDTMCEGVHFISASTTTSTVVFHGGIPPVMVLWIRRDKS